MSCQGNIEAEKLYAQNPKSMSSGLFVQADQYQGFSLHIAASIFQETRKGIFFVCLFI